MGEQKLEKYMRRTAKIVLPAILQYGSAEAMIIAGVATAAIGAIGKYKERRRG